MVEVIDFYVTGWPLLIVAVFEIVTICYIYGTVLESYIEFSGTSYKFFSGAQRFALDIEIMIGDRAPLVKWSVQKYFWLTMWLFVSPLICLVRRTPHTNSPPPGLFRVNCN